MLTDIIKNKKYLSVAGSIVLLVICYQLSFKPTIGAWETHRNLRSRLTYVSDFSYQPGLLERKSKAMDRILERYRSDSSALRENLLARISGIADKEKVRLSEVPVEDPAFHTGQYILERLKFEGDFISLVKTLRDMESTSGAGVPRSITIKAPRETDPNKKNNALSMELLLEVSQ